LEKEIQVPFASKFSPEDQAYLKSQGVYLPETIPYIKTIPLASQGFFLERLLNRSPEKSLEYRFNYLINLTTRTAKVLNGKSVYDWRGQVRVDATESIPVRAKQWANFMVSDFLQIPERFRKADGDKMLGTFEKWYHVVNGVTPYYRDPDQNPTLWSKLYNRFLKGQPLDSDIITLEERAEENRQGKASDALDTALLDPEEKNMLKKFFDKNKIKTVGDVERAISNKIENRSLDRVKFKSLPPENKISCFTALSKEGQLEVLDLLPKKMQRDEQIKILKSLKK